MAAQSVAYLPEKPNWEQTNSDGIKWTGLKKSLSKQNEELITVKALKRRSRCKNTDPPEDLFVFPYNNWKSL